MPSRLGRSPKFSVGILNEKSLEKYTEIQYNFPSPSCKSSLDSDLQSSSSRVSSFSEFKHEKPEFVSSSGYVSEDLELENLDDDEPIFWPSNGKSNWNSEGKWDLFIMSPRKNKVVRRMENIPSRLGKSSKFSVEIVAEESVRK